MFRFREIEIAEPARAMKVFGSHSVAQERLRGPCADRHGRIVACCFANDPSIDRGLGAFHIASHRGDRSNGELFGS